MKSLRIGALGVALLMVLIVTTGAFAGDGKGGLKALGMKVYWSLLDAGQKEEAKTIIADHLAETGPDRLRAASRLIRYWADVTEVMTKEQRLKAVRFREVVKKLPKERRIALLNRLLDRTDRAALAGLIEQSSSAAPEDRLEVGIEILDLVHDALLAAGVERWGLTADQTAKIEVLYEEMKQDLRPVALRLARARAEAVRRGTAILDEEQKAKLDTFKDAVLDKVLTFIRG